ncbi:MAG: NYN domain-containing protein [Deltaproteobacteria bacterium]|nr:MAG: NYN domain-containing protein [Deltaproteobacteria bacterium]RLC16820.1 MAG: NYN domain-containing protein [Deltaproteobacteria bacterium]HHE73988.1 NYN domain-containing protein [Desulfobacteraceae bacterium]
MRTYIYIDGFNFYYGVVKNTPYKWVDFMSLFKKVLNPKHDILAIKYFTARVTGKFDPKQPLRQKTFLRAIKKYIPELSVHFGQFNSHTINAPLAYPIGAETFGKKIKFANIVKTEEKGSDVNLAIHALNDAWLDHYDCAVIVSNDSDLAESLRLIKEQNKKMVGLIFPSTNRKRHPSKALIKHADFTKSILISTLKTCQLPDPIPGTNISKPIDW